MKIKTIRKSDFPEKLKKIKNSPEKIFAIGNTNLLYEESFGIVGTRKISEYGIKNCTYFTQELVYRGIPIVSGMAEGTDSVAHKVALENRGKTIAVLGNGLGTIYPKENEELFNSIIENDGLIITEYDYNTEPLKQNFPKRNRIVSALSEGILVIEAAFRSGTSITVNYAKAQGKNVFALPGRLDNYLGVGVNKLIKEGAIFTTCIDDIININIKKEYMEVYNLLEEKELDLDDIVNSLDMEVIEILKIITNMEIDEVIKKDERGIYKIL